jgi:Flp pilus assembly protein TadG
MGNRLWLPVGVTFLHIHAVSSAAAVMNRRRYMSERSRVSTYLLLPGFRAAASGQSLLEVALFLPLLVLCAAYAVDFGYFFIVSANLSSSTRNAAEYSIQGYQSPGQTMLPVAGPGSTIASVSALALEDLAGLANSATKATVQVCSKAVGITGKVTNCSSYGPAVSTSTATAPQTDPEAPTFLLNRVDVTYTVEPPIPLSFFRVSLLPNMSFHRFVSMRAMD